MNILSFAGIESSQTCCMYVSRYFFLSSEAILWKEACIQTYGNDLTESTIPLYHDNYQQMLLDDGERGALPAQIKSLACH